MTERISVLILGAGVMQLPALRIARGRGWRVIAADADSRAAGAGLADVFEPVDLKDLPGLLACARRHRREGGLDGVFTAGTDFSASVAYLAEQLGLPGIPYETALDATDKGRMRECFVRQGVPHPRFRIFTGTEPDPAAGRDWRFPLVVKPADNMGARGVERVDYPRDLAETCRAAAAHSRSGRVIVEEFIEGPEFSLDALVHAGKLEVCGVADRHIFFPPHFVELGHTMPSLRPEIGALVEVFERGVRALGLTHGAAKGDVFLSPRGPVIGEIAARLSGGYMSGWTYPLSSGVDLTGAALNLAVGLPPGELRPRRAWTSAERAFISIPGLVAEVSGLEAAASIPGVHELFVRVKPGDRVRFPRNNVEKCGNVISALEDREAAVAAAERAAATVFIRLAPGLSETAEFVFGPAFARNAWFEAAAPVGVPWSAARGPARPDAGQGLALGPFRVLGRPPDVRGRPKDWNHRGLPASLAELDSIYSRATAPAWASRLALGGVFWHALLRGGVQAAAWVIDSLAARADYGSVKELLESWQESSKS